MSEKKYYDALDEILDKPIAYNPSFKRITGSTNAAVLLSQGFYWSKRTKDPDGWFWKTREDWMDETGLTESELDGAREKCRSVGVMEEKLKGVPATLHYRVNKPKVYELLGVQFPGFPESRIPPNSQIPGNLESGSSENYNRNTENTTGITPEQLDFLKKAGLEWLLLKEGVTADEIQKAIESYSFKDAATKAFEAALSFSKPLPWWQGKDWTAFGEWVCQEYSRSKTSFGEYNIWRNTPYTKGGIANTRIRSFVNEFYDSWDMFKMANGNKPDESRTSLLRTL